MFPATKQLENAYGKTINDAPLCLLSFLLPRCCGGEFTAYLLITAEDFHHPERWIVILAQPTPTQLYAMSNPYDYGVQSSADATDGEQYGQADPDAVALAALFAGIAAGEEAAVVRLAVAVDHGEWPGVITVPGAYVLVNKDTKLADARALLDKERLVAGVPEVNMGFLFMNAQTKWARRCRPGADSEKRKGFATADGFVHMREGKPFMIITPAVMVRGGILRRASSMDVEAAEAAVVAVKKAEAAKSGLNKFLKATKRNAAGFAFGEAGKDQAAKKRKAEEEAAAAAAAAAEAARQAEERRKSEAERVRRAKAEAARVAEVEKKKAMAKVDRVVATIRAELLKPNPQPSEVQIKFITEVGKKFVSPACASQESPAWWGNKVRTNPDFEKGGTCQQCNRAEVATRNHGLQCSNRGHWVCWACMVGGIDWKKALAENPELFVQEETEVINDNLEIEAKNWRGDDGVTAKAKAEAEAKKERVRREAAAKAEAEAARVAEAKKERVRREAAAKAEAEEEARVAKERHRREAEEKATVVATHDDVPQLSIEDRLKELMKQAEKDMVAVTRDFAPRGMNGYTGKAEALYCAVHKYSKYDPDGTKLDKINELIKAGAPIRNKWLQNSDRVSYREHEAGNNALLTAASEGYPLVVEALIKADPSPDHLDIKGYGKTSALKWAILYNNSECAALLRAAGATAIGSG